MRRTPGGALVLVLLVGACASTPPSTPPPATPVASARDARRDAIDQHAGLWASRRPVAYSYMLDHEDPAGADHGYRYHVSGLEGAVQVQHLDGVTLPDDASTRTRLVLPSSEAPTMMPDPSAVQNGLPPACPPAGAC